jgi:hypothetical protein
VFVLGIFVSKECAIFNKTKMFEINGCIVDFLLIVLGLMPLSFLVIDELELNLS